MEELGDGAGCVKRDTECWRDVNVLNLDQNGGCIDANI